MFSFNTEVLDQMGFEIHMEGPWIKIYPQHNYRGLQLSSVTEACFEAGMTESEVDGICGDITDLVNQRITFRAMVRSAQPREAPPQDKVKKPRPA